MSHRLIVAILALATALCANQEAPAQAPTERPPELDEVQATLVSTTLQPATRPPALSTTSASAASAAAAAAQRASLNNRLASAPEMFGDYFQSGGTLNFGLPDGGGSGGEFGSFTVPPVSGGGPVKIAENNRALPTDRLTFSYSHFHNALQFTQQTFFGAPNTQLFPIDRYTLGFEKTFADGTWSLEIRLPMQGDFEFQGINLSGAGGSMGNLALILKNLLYIDQELSVVAGLGIDTPTGSSFTVTDISSIPTSQLVFQNDALYLLPYVGALWSPAGPHFFNAFLQFDLATGGNRLDSRDLGGPATTLGRFNQQNLLFVDLSWGYWLYQNPQSSGLTGLASVLELHYTSSLQDTDTVIGFAGGRLINYSNATNRFDILNLTAGLQAQFSELWYLRVACVVPLGARDDQRFFDHEFQVQVNRRF